MSKSYSELTKGYTDLFLEVKMDYPLMITDMIDNLQSYYPPLIDQIQMAINFADTHEMISDNMNQALTEKLESKCNSLLNEMEEGVKFE